MLLEFALSYFNYFIFYHNEVIKMGWLFHCNTGTLMKNTSNLFRIGIKQLRDLKSL